jgi:hypothetical protein
MEIEGNQQCFWEVLKVKPTLSAIKYQENQGQMPELLRIRCLPWSISSRMIIRTRRGRRRRFGRTSRVRGWGIAVMEGAATRRVRSAHNHSIERLSVAEFGRRVWSGVEGRRSKRRIMIGERISWRRAQRRKCRDGGRALSIRGRGGG